MLRTQKLGYSLKLLVLFLVGVFGWGTTTALAEPTEHASYDAIARSAKLASLAAGHLEKIESDLTQKGRDEAHICLVLESLHGAIFNHLSDIKKSMEHLPSKPNPKYKEIANTIVKVEEFDVEYVKNSKKDPLGREDKAYWRDRIHNARDMMNTCWAFDMPHPPQNISSGASASASPASIPNEAEKRRRFKIWYWFLGIIAIVGIGFVFRSQNMKRDR